MSDYILTGDAISVLNGKYKNGSDGSHRRYSVSSTLK